MTDPWLDPLLVINRRYRFEHGLGDVAAAREFMGPVDAADEESLARAVVTRVHERMRIRASAFGVGMPTRLAGIVEARGGNCVAHSVLATAVLRDRGVPTRLVVENTYTNASLLRVPAAFVRAPIGPVLNSHVWIELMIDGGWVPADAELGIFGTKEWLAVRVARGVTVRAIGLPIAEHWKFPLRIRRLGPDGMPAEDVTSLYLVDKLSEALGARRAVPTAWVEGVEYFSRTFDWEGRAGLRILREARRLREMSRALAGERLLNLADAERGY
jgi:hypothetical protein